jgi:hypothetical protein
MLQEERSRGRFSMRLLYFSVNLFLPGVDSTEQGTVYIVVSGTVTPCSLLNG